LFNGNYYNKKFDGMQELLITFDLKPGKKMKIDIGFS